MTGPAAGHDSVAGHDIVVIGFSAGGIDPLLQLVGDLPRELPAAVFVVHHFPAQSISALPSILSRSAALPVHQAADGERVVPGHIYVGRPDRHLLLAPGHCHLTRGPREHGNRPALDPLFRSAARSYGPRVIGVILSGTLDDGTVGLHAIKQAGGLAVVQDPEQCAYPGMPLSALQHVRVDHAAPPQELGGLVTRLVHLPAPEAPLTPWPDPTDPIGIEPAVAGTRALRDGSPSGAPSTFSCPECGGILFEADNGDLLHYRCHVGHAYTEESLLAVQSSALESALWSAVRALEEKAKLAQRLADRVRARGMTRSAGEFDRTARDAIEGSEMIRRTLLEGPVGEVLEAPAEPAAERAAGLSAEPEQPEDRPSGQLSGLPR